ncbi:MAG: GIY-YIG nuclease family protein, partial [Parachlamydiales bacterium]|nr:GIY-YIG nuclease family protein [Parachlamydiales bacterium]
YIMANFNVNFPLSNLTIPSVSGTANSTNVSISNLFIQSHKRIGGFARSGKLIEDPDYSPRKDATIKKYAYLKDANTDKVGIKDSNELKQSTNVIYGIWNKRTQKVYIGQTERTALTRLSEHINDAVKNRRASPHLDNAFKKEPEEFSCYLIEENLSQTQLDTQEIFWIKHYGSQDREKGYNLTTGGQGVHRDPSKPNPKRPNWFANLGEKGQERAQKDSTDFINKLSPRKRKPTTQGGATSAHTVTVISPGKKQKVVQIDPAPIVTTTTTTAPVDTSSKLQPKKLF